MKKLIFVIAIVVCFGGTVVSMSKYNDEKEYTAFLEKTYKETLKDCGWLNDIESQIGEGLLNTYRLCNFISSDDTRFQSLREIVEKRGVEGISVLCNWGRGSSLLAVSVGDGDINSVKYLLSFPATKKYFLNFKGTFEDVPLAIALKRKKLGIMKLLVESGAKVCFPYLKKRVSNKINTKKVFDEFREWYEKKYALEKMDDYRIGQLLERLKNKEYSDTVFKFVK